MNSSRFTTFTKALRIIIVYLILLFIGWGITEAVRADEFECYEKPRFIWFITYEAIV